VRSGAIDREHPAALFGVGEVGEAPAGLAIAGEHASALYRRLLEETAAELSIAL
jgi:hypothetical protein